LLLSVEGLSKRFGSNAVLSDVSFSVRDGEMLGLIGPNGAGKTTLFECLAGLVHADGGEVKFRDARIAVAHRKRALFYLPDAIRPWTEQTVKWALDFFGRLYGRSKNDTSETAGALGLERLMGSRISSLSKGELKRALLGLALLTRHQLLLLDEPFDGLDLRQTRDVMALLKTHALGGRTLFLSIHQLVDASRVCDRVVLLSAGKVVGEGTLAQLKAEAGLKEGGLEEVFLALT
jgi:ABC-type multidrug transport system ATPase subunit